MLIFFDKNKFPSSEKFHFGNISEAAHETCNSDTLCLFFPMDQVPAEQLLSSCLVSKDAYSALPLRVTMVILGNVYPAREPSQWRRYHEALKLQFLWGTTTTF